MVLHGLVAGGSVVAASVEAFGNRWPALIARAMGVEQELGHMEPEAASFPTKLALGDGTPHSFGFARVGGYDWESPFENSFPSLLEHTESVLADEFQNLHFECYHVVVASAAFEILFDYCRS
mmetsp:Transcript_2243/g.4737  ORF Transcript_2243/g.4737 Transcript_2243/m.4737 type:complete len:122 (-) Transcript_2243:356-721(-)